MTPFHYHAPSSVQEICQALRLEGSALMAGGTDLLSQMKSGHQAVTHLVSLKNVPGLKSISKTAKGSLLLGAGVTLTDCAEHDLVRRQWPLIRQTILEIASLQLRNVGTVGGNLCQKPRCWYYRRNDACLRNEGRSCLAVFGQSKYHCVIQGGPCYIIHPSDLAVTLTALDAKVHLEGPAGKRVVPLDAFFLGTHQSLSRENVLEPQELLTFIEIPALPEQCQTFFKKIKERSTWDFALVSLAAVKKRDSLSLVFGGIAPTPFVDRRFNRDLHRYGLAVLEELLSEATPLKHNAYKVVMARNLAQAAVETFGP
jgi:xanthine dehydrogenase YagS FAD-binding subunit